MEGPTVTVTGAATLLLVRIQVPYGRTKEEPPLAVLGSVQVSPAGRPAGTVGGGDGAPRLGPGRRPHVHPHRPDRDGHGGRGEPEHRRAQVHDDLGGERLTAGADLEGPRLREQPPHEAGRRDGAAGRNGPAPTGGQGALRGIGVARADREARRDDGAGRGVRLHVGAADRVVEQQPAPHSGRHHPEAVHRRRLRVETAGVARGGGSRRVGPGRERGEDRAAVRPRRAREVAGRKGHGDVLGGSAGRTHDGQGEGAPGGVETVRADSDSAQAVGTDRLGQGATCRAR